MISELVLWIISFIAIILGVGYYCKYEFDGVIVKKEKKKRIEK